MLILGGFLQGSDPTVEDVVEVDAPEKPRPYVLREDLAVGDFETAGYVLNPDFVGDRNEDPTPRRGWVCARCNRKFDSVPFMNRGKVVLIPSVCLNCDPIVGAEQEARCPMRHPELIVRERYYPKSLKNHENFCGWVLKYPATAPIRATAKMEQEPTTTTLEVIPPTPTVPTGHAKHGPSSLKHKEICGHWRSSPGTNPVAEEGTALHERLVTRNFEGLDEHQLKAVTLVADLFDGLVEELGLGAVSHKELRLDVAGITWGTSDLVAFSADGKRGVIADAKFGWVEVEDAETNLQGQCYTVGAWVLEPRCEEMRVVFAQPRCDMVSEHTFYRKLDEPRLKGRIQAAVDSADDPNAPFNPEPENCRYCGAKGSCEALLAMATTIAPKVSATGFVIPAELQAASIKDPRMMAQAVLVAEIMETWASEIREAARGMLSEGTEVPGYELGERQSPRGIESAALAWEAVKDVMTPDEFMTATKGVAIGKLEEAYAAAVVAADPNSKRGAKSKAKQTLENKLNDLGAIRQEGTTYFLKRIKDRKLTEKEKPKQIEQGTIKK